MKTAVLVTFGLAATWLALPASAFTLIKADEAKLPPSSGALVKRGIARGPGVKLISPETGSVTSPFELKIAFEPRGGAQIDPAATKVVYLKATPVDLLPRLKVGLSDKGIELAGAETPIGEHQIQVTVQDSEGRVTNSIFVLNVVK